MPKTAMEKFVEAVKDQTGFTGQRLDKCPLQIIRGDTLFELNYTDDEGRACNLTFSDLRELVGEP
jgi:hypothetical protein